NSTLITRIGIVIGILVSILIGYKLPINIIARGTAIFFGICASTFLPVYFAALYWKRATKTAAKASMMTGFLSSAFALAFLHVKESEPLGICQAIFGKTTLATDFPWMIIDPIIFSLPLSIMALLIVTYLSKKPNYYIQLN
ncbi:MAG: hypothetical protein JJE45_05770, partial [Prolixibacteraceae bacterium]|nr:hypothetical protein [Prolixibacteraceae bacterium]